jgi:hypothetical protein
MKAAAPQNRDKHAAIVADRVTPALASSQAVAETMPKKAPAVLIA